MIDNPTARALENPKFFRPLSSDEEAKKAATRTPVRNISVKKP